MRIVKVTPTIPARDAVLPLRLATCHDCLEAFRPDYDRWFNEKAHAWPAAAGLDPAHRLFLGKNTQRRAARPKHKVSA